MNASKHLILFAIAVLSQESGYLDLTTQTARPRLNEPTSTSGAIAATGAGDRAIARGPLQPLELTISSVEGLEHKAGEVLVYEVKILNSSNEVVKIPSTISPREIEPPEPRPYRYWMATLAPRIVNSSGQIEVLEAALLYGTDSGPTMMDLAPGHWVRIRAKSRISLREPTKLASFLSTSQNSAKVGAVWPLYRVSFAEERGQYHETFVPTAQEIQSANTVPIKLEP